MLNFQRKLRARRQARRDGIDLKDAGFTLPELLMSVILTGLLVSTIATAISVMLKATPQAEIRLSESKDITFLQTFIPVDLATAINSYDDTDDEAIRNKLLTTDPFITYRNNLDGSKLLPGTNVLTLLVPTDVTGVYEIISYRYVEAPVGSGEYQLSRFRITKPGQAGQTVTPVGVAHEIPPPPPGWVEGDPVTHAFEVTARNQVVLRPIGEDIKVTFESGKTFQTGGAGLSAEQDLTPNDPTTLPDPTAPPTRCGGRIALVLDTSYSVPGMTGGAALESAATGFIDSFAGTPTDLTVLGFDQIAYQLYPNLNGERGLYFSLLDANRDANANGIPDLVEAKNNIIALPDRDTYYPYSNAGSPFAQPSSYYINTTGPVGWTQQRKTELGVTLPHQGGTNWEDALHAPFFDQLGVLRPATPELVVWITDGDPNRQRSNDFAVTSPGTHVQAAALAANRGRSTGARIVGVLVGPGGATLESQLAQVVGTNKWNGTGPSNLGNAVAADYFASSFSQLGPVLRSIMAAQCGGTVTVRKQLNDGSSPGGRWTYSSETGDQVLDLATKSSVTFDFTFNAGVISRTITIREEVKAGYAFNRAECTVGGAPVAPANIVQSPDGSPGVQLTFGPDKAISCVMISNPI